jgi:hypothetical protein
LFLQYWRNAIDAFPDATPRVVDKIASQEAELLRLLVDGATDEQVARKLGVSMRTVRRIVAKLSEQVGVGGQGKIGSSGFGKVERKWMRRPGLSVGESNRGPSSGSMKWRGRGVSLAAGGQVRVKK